MFSAIWTGGSWIDGLCCLLLNSGRAEVEIDHGVRWGWGECPHQFTSFGELQHGIAVLQCIAIGSDSLVWLRVRLVSFSRDSNADYTELNDHIYPGLLSTLGTYLAKNLLNRNGKHPLAAAA